MNPRELAFAAEGPREGVRVSVASTIETTRIIGKILG